jgi:hypothetical protein
MNREISMKKVYFILSLSFFLHYEVLARPSGGGWIDSCNGGEDKNDTFTAWCKDLDGVVRHPSSVPSRCAKAENDKGWLRCEWENWDLSDPAALQGSYKESCTNSVYGWIPGKSHLGWSAWCTTKEGKSKLTYLPTPCSMADNNDGDLVCVKGNETY